MNKIQGLQQDIQELRGQLEIQTHDLKSLQQQQLAFYKDLDTRMRGDSTQSAQLSPSHCNPSKSPCELRSTDCCIFATTDHVQDSSRKND